MVVRRPLSFVEILILPKSYYRATNTEALTRDIVPKISDKKLDRFGNIIRDGLRFEAPNQTQPFRDTDDSG